MAWSDKAKAGGGNTVEGVITDYSFMDVFPFGEDKEPDGNIYLLLDITPEGADEPSQRSLYLGSGNFLAIEDDGKVLRSAEDGDVVEDGVPRLYENGEVFKFISSLEEAGFPAEARFGDPSETHAIDFRPMIGTRIRLVNEIDEEATKKFGKRKVTKGKHKGKEFNRTFSKVTKVLDLPDEDAPKAKAKGSAAKGAKGKASAEAEAEDDDDSGITQKQADKFFVGLLNAQPKATTTRSGLPLAITRYAAKVKLSEKERDAFRRVVTGDEYLESAAERGVIEFDLADKKGTISLAE